MLRIVGRNGRVFKFLQIPFYESRCGGNQERLDESESDAGECCKIDNDPRVTKVGHFIRKDESR